LIKAAKQGKVIRWAPPSKHNKGTKTPGVSSEQVSIMREYILPHSTPQSTGLSSYEQIARRYTGAGTDAPMKNVNDPYQSIRDRYGKN
jgi:ABC-type transporter lipoprotein component MlaA